MIRDFFSIKPYRIWAIIWAFCSLSIWNWAWDTTMALITAPLSIYPARTILANPDMFNINFGELSAVVLFPILIWILGMIPAFVYNLFLE